jgi:hypothetical protein
MDSTNAAKGGRHTSPFLDLKYRPRCTDEANGAATIGLILCDLSALTQYLAELRGLYSSGHGRNGKRCALEPRHARLVVGGRSRILI